MSVIQVSSAPSRAAYDAVEQIVGVAGRRPAGMIVHSAAELADGTVLIVDVWESDEAMDSFERDRLLPAFAQYPGGPAAIMSEPPVRHPAFVTVRA